VSFEARETSRDEGSPIELFMFVYGTTVSSYYAYTNAEQPITVNDPQRGPVTYNPIPIKRGVVASSGTLDKTNLEVRTPHDSEISLMYVLAPPAVEVALFIRQAHIDEPENFVVWVGRIRSVSREGMEARMQCEPAQTSIKRNGLRRNWQYGCVLPLYGPNCRAQMDRHTYPNPIKGIVGNVVELAPGWHPNDAAWAEFFTGGMIRWAGAHGPEYRTILNVDNENFLTIGGQIVELEIGMTIDCIIGCNHRQDHCIDLHDNIANYGGQDWIPLENPVRTNPFI
jgi:hypothetical protein